MSHRLLTGIAGLALALGLASTARAAAPDVKALVKKPVVIQNETTKRLLLSTGEEAKAGSDEGGWTKSPEVVGADENYYNRAVWEIRAEGEGYVLENTTTKRLLLSDGDPVKGKEGGWTKSPKVVGADKNYYHRAIWKIVPHGEGFLLENTVTHRLLLSEGEPVKEKEGGWTKSPTIVGADENYYDRAVWTIAPK